MILKNQRVKDLNENALNELSSDVRTTLIETITKTQGPLALSLSMVDLTIALHYVFDYENDWLLFDDQLGIAHKVLTQELERFERFGQVQGLSKYSLRKELLRDFYDASYEGQALSIALGAAMVKEEPIVVVISSDSILDGQVYQALNHLTISNSKVIVVLCDTAPEKSRKSLAMSLRKLTLGDSINSIRGDIGDFFDKGNKITKPIKQSIRNFSQTLSNSFKPNSLFKGLGLKYLGPYDGHDINSCIKALSLAKGQGESCVLHFKVTKGKGYTDVHQQMKGRWVHLNDFDLASGKIVLPIEENKQTLAKYLSDRFIECAANDEDFYLVSCLEVEFKTFKDQFEERYISFSKASDHVFSFVTGLALSNKKPLLLLEDSEMLSGIKQIIHEYSFMNLDITVCLLRSGLNNLQGGAQFQLFNLAPLLTLANVSVYQGSSLNQSSQLLELIFPKKGVKVLRINDFEPESVNLNLGPINPESWQVVTQPQDSKAMLLSHGALVNDLAHEINRHQYPFTLINMVNLKEVDEELLQNELPIYLISDEFINQSISNQLLRLHKQVCCLNYPTQYLGFGSLGVIRKENGMSPKSIIELIKQKELND